MKYLLLLLLLLLLPGQMRDITDNAPVELLYVGKIGDTWVLETDTGARGQGKTLAQAKTDLKDTATGNVYLPTAEALLLQNGGENMEELELLVSRDTQVYRVKRCPELTEAAEYLRHKKGVTLLNCRRGDAPKYLLETEEGYRIADGEG